MKNENFVLLSFLILFASLAIIYYQHRDVKFILQRQDVLLSRLDMLIKELNDYETSN